MPIRQRECSFPLLALNAKPNPQRRLPMSQFYLELVEELHLYMRDGKPLFGGTPDLKRIYTKSGITILIDFKFDRGFVPEADSNMQLRGYLTMTPAVELDLPVNFGYSGEFRPSSLLRFKNCPGALALERSLAHLRLSDGWSNEDAAEGSRLHKAIAAPLAPRDDLEPEQLETVEKAEDMAEQFIQFVLGSNDPFPFYGAIIQPRVSNSANAAVYTHDDIARAKQEVDEIWDRANAPNQPRVAGVDTCKFCPCKSLCPEYRAFMMPSVAERNLPVSGWSDEMMEMFEGKRTELTKWIEKVHAQIKRIKEANPERLPNWNLVPGNKVRIVTDLPAAWQALQEFVSAKQFSDECTLSIGGIEKAIWENRKNTPDKLTQKEAQALVNVRLGEIITHRQNAPSLERKEGP